MTKRPQAAQHPQNKTPPGCSGGVQFCALFADLYSHSNRHTLDQFDYGPPIGGSPDVGPYAGTISVTRIIGEPLPTAGELGLS